MMRFVLFAFALAGIFAAQPGFIEPFATTTSGHGQAAAAATKQPAPRFAAAIDEHGKDFASDEESSGGDRPS